MICVQVCPSKLQSRFADTVIHRDNQDQRTTSRGRLMAEQTASLQNPGNTQGGPPAIKPWFIAVTVMIAAFMELLDTSIANVALPYIGGGLGRSYDEVTWILTTYLVANAVVLPMTAWLSRLLGRKTYYLLCAV
jgi:Major Facilitator Superfamily